MSKMGGWVSSSAHSLRYSDDVLGCTRDNVPECSRGTLMQRAWDCGSSNAHGLIRELSSGTQRAAECDKSDEVIVNANDGVDWWEGWVVALCCVLMNILTWWLVHERAELNSNRVRGVCGASQGGGTCEADCTCVNNARLMDGSSFVGEQSIEGERDGVEDGSTGHVQEDGIHYEHEVQDSAWPPYSEW